MCVIVVAVSPSPAIDWVIAANRDEIHARPTRPAHAWQDDPRVFAGRDMVALGTWLAVTTVGRFAAVTNVRSAAARRDGRSRGELPRRFVTSDLSPGAFAAEVSKSAADYPAFNLLAGDRAGAVYVTEAAAPPLTLPPGVHGVSNGRLGDPWPKLARVTQAMSEAIAPDGRVDAELLFEALRDTTAAPDEALPSTGVPLEIERALSPVFVSGEVYGTRCSTVAFAERGGPVRFEERSFSPNAAPGAIVRATLG